MSTSGGSGGGAALVAVTFSTNVIVDGNVAVSLGLVDTQPSMPNSNQLQATVTSTPTIVAPLGNVLDSPFGSVNNVDTTTATFIIDVVLTVSNLAATEVLQIGAQAFASAGGPGDSATIDFTTADTTPIAGTDLAWDGTSVVTSTTGGVFVVSLSYDAQYE